MRDYDIWYTSASPQGAIGEAFGNVEHWTSAMFRAPYLPVGRRALATFTIADDLAVLDLDDAPSLIDHGLRPSQVVARDPVATQAFALRAFGERRAGGGRRWAGTGRSGSASPSGPPRESRVRSPSRVEALDLGHPAVTDAAASLARPL